MKSLKELIADNIPTTNFVNRLVFGGLGVTTAITANNIALEKLSGTFLGQPVVAGTLSVIIAGAIAFIFDHGLRKNFISALLMFSTDDFSTAKASIKLVVFGFLIIATFRLLLSTGATFISAIFISDKLVEDGNTEQLEEMLANKEKTKQDITLTLARQISDIRKDAESRADDVVRKAVESGGKRWATLWQSGNSWVRTVKGGKYKHVEKWREGIYKAQAKADEIRQEASKQIAALQSSQTQLIEAETNDKSFAAITSIKARQIEKLEQKESVTKLSLWMIDAVLSIVAILTSIALAAALKCYEGYEIFKKETSLADVLREAWNAFRRIILSRMVYVVAKMDLKAKLVATSLSNGEGSIQLEAETLRMYRKPPSQASIPNPDRLQIGSTVDIHNASPTSYEWNVGRSSTPADNRVPTVADNADNSRRQLGKPNNAGPSKRVGDTADTKTVVVNTTTIKGVPYVEHVGRNGKKMKWTRRDVEKNLSTYQSRMETAKENGKEIVYENNKSKVELMHSYLNALDKEDQK